MSSTRTWSRLCITISSGADVSGLPSYASSRHRNTIVFDTDWLPDWLTDWLTDRLTDWLTDRLTDWLTDRLTDWLTDRLHSGTQGTWALGHLSQSGTRALKRHLCTRTLKSYLGTLALGHWGPRAFEALEVLYVKDKKRSIKFGFLTFFFTFPNFYNFSKFYVLYFS